MKTTFAQIATFAFTAAGALAIFVGTFDQTVMASQAVGVPAIGLVPLTATPTVSPMA